MLSQGRVIAALAVALSVAGCGVRTSLDLFDDGSRPRPDGSVADGGVMDGGGAACRRDAECNDGLECTGIELCVGGRCVAGTRPMCSDGIDCTVDSCVEGSGCVSRPDDGLCGPGGVCDPRLGCAMRRCASDLECGDGLACNGTEVCGPGGVCRPGMPIVCPADPFACTEERCDEAGGGVCVSVPDSSACPPGELCAPTPGDPDGCRGVRCRVDPDCDDGSFCNGAERCVRGLCRRSMPVACEPTSECQIATCSDAAGTCVVQPRSARELCGNGIEDDCDGLRDCADPDCRTSPACACVPTAPVETQCGNGVDEDCDGAVDCADAECAMTAICLGRELFCGDGDDDDGDGLVDCRDPDCFADVRCRDAGGPRDAGVLPGDGGGLARELGIAACTNGIDDDGDGRSDCSDPDCRPFGPTGECCNGIDDVPGDDTPEDVFTCRCFDDSVCAGVSPYEQVCWTRSSFFVCAPDCRFLGGSTWCSSLMAGLPRCDTATGQCVP